MAMLRGCLLQGGCRVEANSVQEFLVRKVEHLDAASSDVADVLPLLILFTLAIVLPAYVHPATAPASSSMKIIHLPPFLVQPVLVGAYTFRKKERTTQRPPYAMQPNILCRKTG
jgi:hypothetical protein